jgi:hypothetical protein
MTRRVSDPIDQPDHADATWFREPTRREHWIAAGLFTGFGLFFVAMFYLCYGWGFRWVLLGLAVWSIGYGMRHALDGRRRQP